MTSTPLFDNTEGTGLEPDPLQGALVSTEAVVPDDVYLPYTETGGLESQRETRRTAFQAVCRPSAFTLLCKQPQRKAEDSNPKRVKRPTCFRGRLYRPGTFTFLVGQ